MRRRSWQSKAALAAILALLVQVVVPMLPAQAGERTVLCDPVRGTISVTIDAATGEPVEAPENQPPDCCDHCVLCTCVTAEASAEVWRPVAIAESRIGVPPPSGQLPPTWREHARQPRGPPASPLA